MRTGETSRQLAIHPDLWRWKPMRETNQTTIRCSTPKRKNPGHSFETNQSLRWVASVREDCSYPRILEFAEEAEHPGQWQHGISKRNLTKRQSGDSYFRDGTHGPTAVTNQVPSWSDDWRLLLPRIAKQNWVITSPPPSSLSRIDIFSSYLVKTLSQRSPYFLLTVGFSP